MSSKSDDGGLIIDLLLGECPPPQARELHERISVDPEFRNLKRDIENTLGVIKLLPEASPPEDLVSRTLDKVSAARLTNSLIAREETSRRWTFSTFSMREVGTIAAAVLLLAVVFVPSVRKARQRMLISECGSNLGQIGSAISAYAASNNEYLPYACEERRPWMSVSGQEAVSNSSALFKLLRSAHVSPKLFQCPAKGIESLAVVEGMTDFPSERYVGYSYQHTLTPQGRMRRSHYSPSEQEKMVILSDTSPVFGGGRFNKDRLLARTSDNHGNAGQNVLNMNSSVAWVSDSNVGVEGDNIFLAEGIYDYHGEETPTSRTDSFLLPAYAGN